MIARNSLFAVSRRKETEKGMIMRFISLAACALAATFSSFLSSRSPRRPPSS